MFVSELRAARAALDADGLPDAAELERLRGVLTNIIALADGLDPSQPLLGHWRQEVLRQARAALEPEGSAQG